MKAFFKSISFLAAVTSVVAQTTQTSITQVFPLGFNDFYSFEDLVFYRECGNEPSAEDVLQMEADFAANGVSSDFHAATPNTPLAINVSFVFVNKLSN